MGQTEILCRAGGDLEKAPLDPTKTEPSADRRKEKMRSPRSDPLSVLQTKGQFRALDFSVYQIRYSTAIHYK